jgi:hypothetical protein
VSDVILYNQMCFSAVIAICGFLYAPSGTVDSLARMAVAYVCASFSYISDDLAHFRCMSGLSRDADV